jgi:hypothetical protein
MSALALSRREVGLLCAALVLPLLAVALIGLSTSLVHTAQAGAASLVPGANGNGNAVSVGKGSTPASADASRSESGRSDVHARIFGGLRKHRANRTGTLVDRLRSTGETSPSSQSNARGGSSPAQSGNEGTTDDGENTGPGESGPGSPPPSGAGPDQGTSGSASPDQGISVIGASSTGGVAVSAKDEDHGAGVDGSASDPASGGGISVDSTSDDAGTGVNGPATGISVP